MIPTEVFDCFAQGDYIPLMAQAAMEHALSPRVVDQLFEETADRQYTGDLLFSSVVGLMSLVVCRIRPSINAAYQKNAVPMSLAPSALRKDRCIEPAVGAAMGAPYGRASVSGHHHHERRHHAAVARLSHQDPRRQPSARVRASHQRVADHGACRFAGAHLGRTRPPVDARHRRLPLRGWPCAGAFAVGASRGDRPAQGSLGSTTAISAPRASCSGLPAGKASSLSASTPRR